MLVRCPKCKTTYDLDEDRAGKRVSCKCGVVFRIPMSALHAPPLADLPPAQSAAPSARAIQGLILEEQEYLETPQVVSEAESPLSAYKGKDHNAPPPTPVTVNLDSLKEIRTDLLADAVVDAAQGGLAAGSVMLINCLCFFGLPMLLATILSVLPPRYVSVTITGILLGALGCTTILFSLLLRSKIGWIRPFLLLALLANIFIFVAFLIFVVWAVVVTLGERSGGDGVVSALIFGALQTVGLLFAVKGLRWIYAYSANRYFEALAGR